MIRLSIRNKLALVLGCLSLLVVALTLILVRASFDRAFHDYLNDARQARLQDLAARVSRVLAEAPGQLERWQLDRRRWAEDLRGLQAELAEADPEPHRRPPRTIVPWLLDPEGQVRIGPARLPPEEILSAPLKVQDRTLGYLAWPAIQVRDLEPEALFAQQQHRLFLLSALAALLLSLALAWPLSAWLVRPIQRLSSAMHALMGQRQDVQVAVTSNDELGDLARDFNHMARSLAEQQQSQRQWLADISHELRTPLAVLQGELEAMEDGLIEPGPEALASLQDEVRQLGRLVDDLHELALSDLGALRYRFEPLDLAALLRSLATRLGHQLETARLSFELQLPETPVPLRGDPQRLEQLLLNLAQNSIRYTEPGGTVRVRLDSGNPVLLRWEDSAPGVEEADLPHLFERFYRVDKSRQRARGGSGLGLAIVANIVDAHSGRIRAEHSPLGGLCILIEFPKA